MSLFAGSCRKCGARVPPGQTLCARCKAGTGRATSCLVCGARTNGSQYCPQHALSREAERVLRQPFRVAYHDPIYLRNRQLRFRLAGGRCEVCGRDLGASGWECDHVVALVDGGDNSVTNLRALCRDCHHAKTRQARRKRKETE